MLRPPVVIPQKLERVYLWLRITLWIAILLIGSLLLLALLFPDFTYTFSFQTPNSSKNNLLDPRLSDGTPRPNGKFASDQSLTVDAGVLGDFSMAKVRIDLENKSELPSTVRAELRRSYRAFLYPAGNPVDAFPNETLYLIDGTHYALREGILHPFVSSLAYGSRYPEDFAVPESRDFLKRYPLADDFLGFRVGSLLSFADGVFIVTSETDIRPVGSAEIFLTLGYRFPDVLPVSEEDIGIYKRGRILLVGAVHPDGTLFQDSDSGTVFVIEGHTKRPLTDPRYRDFLMKKQTPILASESASKQTKSCTLVSGLFPRTFTCSTALDELRTSPGSDYELTLSDADKEINIRTLTLSLETRKNSENVLFFLSQIKQRLLNRFGYGN